MNGFLNIKGLSITKLTVFFLILFTFLFKFAGTSHAANIAVKENVIGRVLFDITTDNRNEFSTSVVGIFNNGSCSGEPVWGTVSLENTSTAPPWTAEARWAPPSPDLLFYAQLIVLGGHGDQPIVAQLSNCLPVRSAGTQPIDPLDEFSCDEITLTPSDNLAADTEIEFTIIGFRGPAGDYRVDVFPTDGENINNTLLDVSLPSGNLASGIINPPNTGSFKARLIAGSTPTTGRPPCESQEFTIQVQGELGSGRNPCVGEVCRTAFGDIPTDITKFAGKALSIALGVAGGIALILLVYGSIRVLTSSGNQQSLATGRDIIIAAIAGLLFLILSVLILRALGLIVGIPFL